MEAICKNALQIDETLCELDTKINWLEMVSPTHNLERWNKFKSTNYSELLPMTYKEAKIDLDKISKQLAELNFSKIDNPAVAALLHEKKEELDLFVDLIKYRETDGFLSTSISLFGGTEPDLLNLAIDILRNVLPQRKPKELSPVSTFTDCAKKIRSVYQAIDPTFNFNINVEEDLNSSLMVNHGNLYVSKDMHISKKRVRALVAHEVEVHIITFFNGSKQPLKLLKTGLASYDVLQEGLATFFEYLAGNLSRNRLRELAARVVASDLAVKGESVQSIFAHLTESYGINDYEAFDTAIRAKRGGGLTKDAVYLQGLRQVHSYVKAGDDLRYLFLGKFSLNQRQILTNLLDAQIIKMPKLVPTLLDEEETLNRLHVSKRTELIDLTRRI